MPLAAGASSGSGAGRPAFATGGSAASDHRSPAVLGDRTYTNRASTESLRRSRVARHFAHRSHSHAQRARPRARRRGCGRAHGTARTDHGRARRPPGSRPRRRACTDRPSPDTSTAARSRPARGAGRCRPRAASSSTAGGARRRAAPRRARHCATIASSTVSHSASVNSRTRTTHVVRAGAAALTSRASPRRAHRQLADRALRGVGAAAGETVRVERARCSSASTHA